MQQCTLLTAIMMGLLLALWSGVILQPSTQASEDLLRAIQFKMERWKRIEFML